MNWLSMIAGYILLSLLLVELEIIKSYVMDTLKRYMCEAPQM